MKSLRYRAAEQVEVVETAKPEIGPGEVLIKVAYAGVCGSDMIIYRGIHSRAKAPLIMGHEFSGVIESGHGTLPPGTPVTVYPLLSCGRCQPCRSGYAHVCDTLGLIGIDRDGGMAEYVKVPEEKIVPLPPGFPLKLGAFIEPVAVGVHAVSRSRYRPGDSAVVYGAGPIGLCVAGCLSYFGASRVIVIEANPHRLDVARQMGFTTIDAAREDVRAGVREHTQGRNADLAFDCAAHPSVQDTILDILRVQGTGIVVGSYKKPAEVDLIKIEFKELTLVGIRVYEWRDFETATAILRSGRVDFERLLSVAAPEEAPRQFARLLAGDTDAIKLLFKLGE
ncbi:MAG: alcohol dehydrogenase catalytic domain-containing protein [Candidatus Accumulibacter sp.]|jgi:2-desacetyl-2-hydroxyethyl bacteriochlorophyllide A dehydrogenase|nr:alcohol dehydrogenase catalytic domain-containing protein [Accumulibacter sp.]